MNRFFAILIITLISYQSIAQTVTGIVTDAQTAETIIGANISIKNTTKGAISDIDGTFKLEDVAVSDTLIVTYLGYETLEIPVIGKSYIEINLSSKTSELEEVIVVGYGRQKKRHIAGAIARVNSEDIESLPILRAEQALQGKTAGVQVTTQSGQPGDAPTVRIRGIGTTRNSNPVYIVDGMPVGNIDYLNPSDIETIDVLKDAATAAIYGSQSANGVVLVTTKKGKAGKLQLEYNGYYGIQNTTNKLDLLNADQYKMIMNEGARNAGLSEPFDSLEISTYETDWQAALFETNAPIFNHSVGITGGNEKSTFASSFSYFSQEGIIGAKKSKFERITARINSQHQVNQWLNFGNNLGYTNLTKRGIATNQSLNGIFNSALNMDPLTPLFELDEDAIEGYNEFAVTDTAGNVFGISENLIQGEVINPLAFLEIDKDKTRKDELVGNIFAELEPIKGLKFKTSIGVDLAYVLTDGYTPFYYLNAQLVNTDENGMTRVFKVIDRYFTWQWDNTIFYETKINKHNFSILGGTSAQEYKFENLDGSRGNIKFIEPEQTYLNLATDTLLAFSGADHSALASLFGRLTYNYDDRISLTAIVRRDGSSKFGPNNRYGVFPSIGLAWVISEEAFMPQLGAVNYLKLRTSWGINGNQDIGNYQFISPLEMTTRFYNFGDGPAIGASPEYLENKDIGWEEALQFGIGADIGLFENRMDITLDYYVEETRNLLERIRIPAHVGNAPPDANVGTVKNTGFEAAINWRNKTKNFKYSVGLNASYNKNKMTKIGDVSGVINGAAWLSNVFVTRSEVGLPIAYFWGFKTDGIFQNRNEVFSHINNDGELLQPEALPGDVRFVDYNTDGIIDEMDRTYMGNPTPDVTAGFTGNINFKNIECSAFIQGSFGHQIFNGIHRKDLRFTNHTTELLNRWTGEGTSNTEPRYTWGDNNNNYRVSDLYIEDASFVRLKNIQLGYTLPLNISQKANFQKVKFYLSGENLITLTNYSGIDPEIGAFGSFDIGIDRGIYPQARTVRFGTEIIF